MILVEPTWGKGEIALDFTSIPLEWRIEKLRGQERQLKQVHVLHLQVGVKVLKWSHSVQPTASGGACGVAGSHPYKSKEADFSTWRVWDRSLGCCQK